MDGGDASRHYQGFSYPTSSPSRPADGQPGVPAYPAAGATGMVRRTAAPVGAASGGGGGGGYGYFHRPTSSAGGNSGFALSDAGSSHGYGGAFMYPPATASAASSKEGGSTPQARSSAVQVRVGAGPGMTPSPSTTAVVFTGQGPLRPSGPPPHTAHGGPGGSVGGASATAAVGFLPFHEGAGSVDEGSAAVAVPERPAAAPYQPSQPYTPPAAALAGPSGRFGAQPYQPQQPPAAPGGGGGGGGGFLRDVMKRMLSDLDDSGPQQQQQPGGDGYCGDGQRPLHQTRFGCPDDDLPLLEELGVHPQHIWRKARAVLNPFRPMPMESVEDTDLAGPIVFAVSLAFLLSLQGKIQFSAVYGLSVLGVLLFKALLTLMHRGTTAVVHNGSTSSGSAGGAPLQFIISSLGYALLPSLLLAVLRTVQFWLAGSYSSYLLPLAFVVIAWSSWCATSLIVRGLQMEPQRYLILYPMLLFYSLFSALTIF